MKFPFPFSWTSLGKAIAVLGLALPVARAQDPGQSVVLDPPDQLPFVPAEVEFDGPRRRLWATEAVGRRVWVVDLARPGEAIRFTLDRPPGLIALTSDGTRAYVLAGAQTNARLAELDLERRLKVREVPWNLVPGDLVAVGADLLVASPLVWGSPLTVVRMPGGTVVS
ncbi:MAG: hypothetical protein ACKO3N_01230 [Verrucomicrobiota bacterium]